MLSFSQKVRVGLELLSLCQRNALVRHYISMMLMVAPRYRQLFKFTMGIKL